jgi:hypothetical protein
MFRVCTPRKTGGGVIDPKARFERAIRGASLVNGFVGARLFAAAPRRSRP